MDTSPLSPTRFGVGPFDLVKRIKLLNEIQPTPTALGRLNIVRRAVLTSRAVNAGISSVLEALRDSNLDEARRRLQAVAQDVRNERGRGCLLAAQGIYSSLSKAKDGAMASWDPVRIERAAKSINSSQLADDFDQGYAETLLSYSRLTQKPA
jgi:hypothetical protein